MLFAETRIRPDGNCRVCMVEIEGERVLAASCIRNPAPGMKVKTATDRAKTARKMVAELLLTDQPAREVAHDPDSEFWKVATRMELKQGRFPRRATPAPDRSHVAMAVNLDACIQCNLCVRACREVQVNDVIGMAGRGFGEKIVFDFDDPMGNSTCVACGECVQACPTGALMPATMVDDNNVYKGKPDRTVDSVCPYCGVGCQLTYQIKDDKIVAVAGKDGPANQNRLCVKGRFGFDYVHNPQRLLKPMIRKDGVAESAARGNRSVQSVDAFPRGDLGRGARSRGFRLEENPRPRRAARRWPASARPRARTRKRISSRNWCAPASAPTMSITAPGCATPRRWRRCSKASARRR